jgi:RHS repeat-associated protein
LPHEIGYFDLMTRIDESPRRAAGIDAKTSWLRKGSICMLEQGPDGALKDIVTDEPGSIVATGDANGLKARGYTAYGYAPSADSTQSALGYNGEYTDPVTGNYHLGNGYRAFSPTLMRFTAPDSLSPFGRGGLNTYVYCKGDPVNAIDPTGHMKWWQWGLTALAIGGTVLDAGELAVGILGFLATGSDTLRAAETIAKFAPIVDEAAGAERTVDFSATTTRLGGANKFEHGIVPTTNAGSSVFHGLTDSEPRASSLERLNSARAPFTEVEHHGIIYGREESIPTYRGRDDTDVEAWVGDPAHIPENERAIQRRGSFTSRFTHDAAGIPIPGAPDDDLYIDGAIQQSRRWRVPIHVEAGRSPGEAEVLPPGLSARTKIEFETRGDPAQALPDGAAIIRRRVVYYVDSPNEVEPKKAAIRYRLKNFV